jgi:hypothetical protein
LRAQFSKHTTFEFAGSETLFPILRLRPQGTGGKIPSLEQY